MKLLNKYVLREWLSSFVCTYLVITCLLLLEDVYKNFFYFIKANVPFLELIKYSIFLTATFCQLVMPVAIFISTLFALVQLHKKNEIITMRCTGMNLAQIVKPIILVGVILSVVNLFFEAFVSPKALDFVANFRERVDSAAGYNSFSRKVGFYNNADNRIWFFNSIDKSTYAANGITVCCIGDDNCEESRIFSETAAFDQDKKFWTFNNCNVITFDKNTNLPSKIDLFDSKEFYEFNENTKTIIASQKKMKDLSFSETIDCIRYIKDSTMVRPFLVKFHKTFSNAFGCLIVMLLAIPFAVRGVRMNPFVNVAQSSCILLAFFMINAIFATLGGNGAIKPIIAAWLGNIITIIPVVKMFKRAM